MALKSNYRQMKKILKSLVLSFCILFVSTSCEDYFETNPDRLINNEDYISENNDMYTGYMGIIIKMQEVADQMVIMSDIRANYLEPNINTTKDILDLYYYQNTTNNKLADPAGFYGVILACNDYLAKMKEYKGKLGSAMSAEDETSFEAMVSGALRFKAWAYFKLANLYGEVVYFDDPIKEAKDLTDASVFTHIKSYNEIIQKCLDIIDYGYPGLEGIDGSKTLNWGLWLNPESINPESTYQIWYRSTPDYVCLRSDILLASNNPDYAWIKEQALTYLNTNFTSGGRTYILGTNNNYQNGYPGYFLAGKGTAAIYISAVIYDGYNDQVNSLYDYFVKERLVKGSINTLEQYGETEPTGKRTPNLYWNLDGENLCTKYYGGLYNINGSTRFRNISRNEFPNDAAIPIYRAHDLHFFLAEAENHLGNWDTSKTILMGGVSKKMSATGVSAVDTTGTAWNNQWRDPRWFSWGEGDDKNRGLRYDDDNSNDTYNLPIPEDPDYDITEEERIKAYDMAIMHEYMLEYVAEGKAMDMLHRMARRYNDMSIIADKVVAKYPEGQQAQIRSKIEGGDFFIKWDLFNTELEPESSKSTNN